MSYDIYYSEHALKEFENLDNSMRHRIKKAIEKLRQFPNLSNIKRLKYTGHEDYRLKIGDYRIIFRVNEKKNEIYILALGHRKDIYDLLE